MLNLSSGNVLKILLIPFADRISADKSPGGEGQGEENQKKRNLMCDDYILLLVYNT